MAQQSAVARLQKEYLSLQRDPAPFIRVSFSETSPLQWDYVLEGPPNSPYEGGLFWGRLRFTQEYPFKPPQVMMLTPNGRFLTGQRLCLSMSDYHPESWQAAWSLRTLLVGLLSFMLEETPTAGAINPPLSMTDRKTLAMRSRTWNLEHEAFRKAFEGVASPEECLAESALAEESSVAEVAVPAVSAEVTGASEELADAGSPDYCRICFGGNEDGELIYPCACRGSMRYVHRSCIEEWLRQRPWGSDDRSQRHGGYSDFASGPRCDLCGQKFCGVQQGAGCLGHLRGIAELWDREAVHGRSRLTLFSFSLALSQVALYCVSVNPPKTMPLWLSRGTLVYFYSFQLIQAIILFASLPYGREAPGSCLRCFFIEDRTQVQLVHVSFVYVQLCLLLWGSILVLPAVPTIAALLPGFTLAAWNCGCTQLRTSAVALRKYTSRVALLIINPSEGQLTSARLHHYILILLLLVMLVQEGYYEHDNKSRGLAYSAVAAPILLLH